MSSVLEFCWDIGVDMVSLIGCFLPTASSSAKMVVSMCTDLLAPMHEALREVITSASTILRRVGMSRYSRLYAPCRVGYQLYLYSGWSLIRKS
jgi:hypothetical protein